MTIALAVLGALTAGYILGRLQPYNRLAAWAHWQLRFRLDRWTSRPRMVVLGVLLLATDPIHTIRAWRHRNDPPPRSPAPTIRRINQPDDTA